MYILCIWIFIKLRLLETLSSKDSLEGLDTNSELLQPEFTCRIKVLQRKFQKRRNWQICDQSWITENSFALVMPKTVWPSILPKLVHPWGMSREGGGRDGCGGSSPTCRPAHGTLGIGFGKMAEQAPAVLDHSFLDHSLPTISQSALRNNLEMEIFS